MTPKTGVISTSHYTYETAIAYSDIGPDQRLSQSGMLRILQEAASIASDDVGYGLKDIPRTGVHWILTAWRLELKRRPVWRTPLRVETWPRMTEGFACDRNFLAYEDGGQVAEAASRWILVSAKTGKPVRITDAERTAYRRHASDRDVFNGAPLPHNGSTPPGAAVTFETTAGRRDIDTNNHVNNLHYLDYAIEALPEEIYQNLPATVEIVFRRQILLGTPIRCLYAQTPDGRHQVEIQSEADGKVTHHAYVWFY